MKKRRRNLMIVCVVLGAIVNIAVAWGCAIWSRPDSAEAQAFYSFVGEPLWREIAPADWPKTPMSVSEQRSLGVTLLVANIVRHPSNGLGDIPLIETWHVVDYRFGWPMLCVRATGRKSTEMKEQELSGAWRLSLSVSWAGINPGQMLAYRPLWLGLLANTIFYAAIIWLLIRGPFELRRRIRQLRMRCQACGYPIGTSPVCTECGVPVPRGWLSPVESTARLQRPLPHSPDAPLQTEDRSPD